MVRCFALILLIAAVTSAIDLENTQYLITTPYHYYTDQNETINVQIFGTKPCAVNVTLKSRYNSGLVASANGTFEPGERGNLPIYIPANVVTSGKEYFKLQANVCAKNSDEVNVKVTRRSYDDIVFIQTDKPIYKPRQKIRMRIIVLDRKLKPKEGKIDSVRVSVSSSRINQWDNVELQDGFASLELQLSKEPVLGQYDITVIVGKKRESQRIEVSKYVLPKYEVNMKLPPYMALDQKEFTTSICAKYTHGKNVKGMLTAQLCLRHSSYEYWQWKFPSFTRCENITKEIDGCTDITMSREALNMDKIINIDGSQFVVDSQVTETVTGVTLKKKAVTKDFTRRSVKLSFDGNSNNFKPGLPFSYVLKVTHPDDSPATGAKVRVTISHGYHYNLDAIFYDKTFVVRNGLITDSIHDETYVAKSLHFQARLLGENSYVVYGKHHRYYANTQKRFLSAPLYSPSFSYLEILKKKTPAMIGNEASLTVRYTAHKDTGKKVDFYYTVMCKGKFVKIGKKTRHHNFTLVEETTTTASTTTTAALTTSNANNGAFPTVVKEMLSVGPSLRDAPDRLKKLNTRPLVKKFDIEFPVTMEMMPSCRVMVYYVREDKEVVADSVEFDVEDKLENQVSVSFAENELKPGEKAKLILKASPGSRVAYVALDKSIHILKSGNKFTKDKVHPYLREHRSKTWSSNPKCNYWEPWGRRKRGIAPLWEDYEDVSAAFDVAGLVFLSNLHIFTKQCTLELGTGGSGFPSNDYPPSPPVERSDYEVPEQAEIKNERIPAKQKAVKIRKDFPETWLWSDEKLDESGNKTIEVTVPGTITSWVANGFAISSKTGIGVSETSTLRAFQPFFVSMTLPYSVIRGEEIPVIVTVFNYRPNCAAIKLELNHKQADYKVTSYHINKLCVCGSEGKSVKFTIIPINLGHIPLTVMATSTTSLAKLCSNNTIPVYDAVTRKLLVEAEGIRKEFTQGTLFCPGNKKHTEEFNLRVPANYIPGSIYPTVTIIGDIMGPAMMNLDDLLRMPYGCGEQNMANFAPNIYIMDYLTQTNQATEGIKSKAENFMKVGYQRELIYKRRSGSYSAFGESDSEGSMMLTAFVVRSFARAKRYIFVDGADVQRSFRWFRIKQLDNGCFPQYGKVFNRRLQGGVNTEHTITAYVTTALLEAGETTNSTMVSKALRCIVNRFNTITDTYSTALVTYALTLANHTDAQRMLRILKNKATKEEDQMYWTNGIKPAQNPRFYPHESSADVEMTAYALLSILHQTPIDEGVVNNEIMDIIRWLSRQRNSRGGFSSTQDTCVALQAVAEFAKRAYGDSTDFNSIQLTGSLKIGDHYNHNFVVTMANKLTLQTVELPQKIIPGKLEVTGQGVGCALVQASVKYNIPEPEHVPAFDIKVDVRTRSLAPDEETTQCSPLKLEITTNLLKQDVSNMAVVDIKLVTGFSVREESLENLRNDPALKFKRYDIDGQNVQLYFDEIRNITFSIDIHQDTLVKRLRLAVVQVYDYYEPERQAKVMYRIGETECYGNRVGAECPRCVTLEILDAIIECNSTVTRMKSSRGMLRVVKAYSKDSKEKGRRIMKKELEYHIPEFCPCDEIYDREQSIVIGRNNYFQDDGRKITVVLNSETSIYRYTGRAMMRQIKKQLFACKRTARKRGN
ncbi:alpha-2-macroglobulin-like protein 1 isoform X2 [Dendronephthya gigantea]|uniref:alpha-2-macroglobulin-like protein 1 isoform X2 n=1 Tax=Dendronephthya gigantea TaxID=151771 RepID=UPI00106CF322|nr:alpha-2-macroglobulin-like protein 1 isoform X2 [Dendronephthya gigantea]